MNGTLGAYKNVAIATADPRALVIQLFDGALRFLGQATRAQQTGDGAGFAFALNRAHAIIGELSNSLDRETGSAAAQELDRLYDFMLRYLTEGLVQKSAAHVERVAALLLPLRDGFDAALRG